MSSPSLLPELSRRSTSDTNATTQRVPAVTRNWRLPANHRRIDYSAEQNWLILPSRDHNGKAGNRRVRVADGAPPLPTTSSASFPRANSGTVADAAVAATAESDIDIDIDDIQVDGNVAVQPNDGSASEADVFFLHHTTYFVGLTPNIAIQKERKDFGIARCIKLFMSAFGHCRLYAPAYRQARIDMYLRGERGNVALDIAYQDCRDAFVYYINHFNQGRPFIIASHSQGSLHATRLLLDLFDRPPATTASLSASSLLPTGADPRATSSSSSSSVADESTPQRSLTGTASSSSSSDPNVAVDNESLQAAMFPTENDGDDDDDDNDDGNDKDGNSSSPDGVGSTSSDTVDDSALLRSLSDLSGDEQLVDPSFRSHFVAAYVIGYSLGRDTFQHLAPSSCATDTGCWISWSAADVSFTKVDKCLSCGRIDSRYPSCTYHTAKPLVHNPLTWLADDEPVSGQGIKADAPRIRERIAELAPLNLGTLRSGKVYPGVVGACVYDGMLRIDTSDKRVKKLLYWWLGPDVHAMEYELFWVNIRENVERRVRVFLARQQQRAAAAAGIPSAAT